jgi:Ni,Fe-hydrogenase I cytochrome b subunit
MKDKLKNWYKEEDGKLTVILFTWLTILSICVFKMIGYYVVLNV